MNHGLRLLCVLAHPDDESLGTGGTLARYAAEGIETYLLTATRGQRGWFGIPAENPGLHALGQIRERELRRAAEALDIRQVDLLDYCDGDLTQAATMESIESIVTTMRRVRPDVVVTFGPDGAYGHPDHIAISQLATTAAMLAADPGFCQSVGLEPHRVVKLYYRIWTAAEQEAYTEAFGEITMDVHDVTRYAVGWPDWTVTTRLDTTEHWRAVWRAVECHRTQLTNYQVLLELSDEQQMRLWGTQSFYRAMSTVDTGSGIETDLFAGLR